MPTEARVLSIQSHVVHGYVGNKSATFPLQVLGFEVDGINSVQFSNHTGYRAKSGQILSDGDLLELMTGLDKNGINRYSHLLTGYIGSASFLKSIVKVLEHLKCINPNLTYVCDPVMGDNGEMYVAKDLLPIYQNMIIPLADVLTPNQFEAELLTGQKITNMEEAWKSIEILHEKGCKTVVFSSTELGPEDVLVCMASSKTGSNSEAHTIEIPKLPVNYTGSGDLFTALFLAWMDISGTIKIALENTVATMQAVLRRTLEYAKNSSPPLTTASKELRLIQSLADIQNPVVTIFAQEYVRK